MRKSISLCLLALGLSISQLFALPGDSTKLTGKAILPDADNAGLKLPAGFGAIKVADSVGRARHIAITDKGTIYVKLSRLVNGKGIVVLRDNDGDGRAEEKKFWRFCWNRYCHQWQMVVRFL